MQSIEIKFHTLGDKSLNNLLSILDNSENENNQLKTSTFILDRILQYQQLELLKRINNIEERLDVKWMH